MSKDTKKLLRKVDEEVALLRKAKKRTKGGGASPSQKEAVFGAPHVRKGENVMGSRGYSFARLVGYLTGAMQPDQCKHELHVSQELRKAMRGCGGHKDTAKSVMAPLSPAFMLGEHPIIDRSFASTLKTMLWEGASGGYDPENAEWLAQRFGITQKSWTPDTMKVNPQSWNMQSLGGTLIDFPEMGPLIPLLRNRNALMTAGASMLPLPPQGSISFPRQDTPTTGYWVGEGKNITASNVTTDQFTLRAKKLGGLMLLNNELIRYGGPVVEQMFRNDLTLTLSLTLDYAGLQAEGSDNVPAGLIGYPGVQQYTAGVTGANGNQIVPQDLYNMVGQILAANVPEFTGWIIRPELLMTMAGKRTSVLAAGDNLGVFLWDLTRSLNEKRGKETYFLVGSEVTQSANVPANRVKGSASNLTTLYGGWWEDFCIGTFGTIEFAIAEQGGDATGGIFANDQSLIRAIMSADLGPKHPAGFIYADQLSINLVGN